MLSLAQLVSWGSILATDAIAWVDPKHREKLAEVEKVFRGPQTDEDLRQTRTSGIQYTLDKTEVCLPMCLPMSSFCAPIDAFPARRVHSLLFPEDDHIPATHLSFGVSYVCRLCSGHYQSTTARMCACTATPPAPAAASPAVEDAVLPRTARRMVLCFM